MSRKLKVGDVVRLQNHNYTGISEIGVIHALPIGMSKYTIVKVTYPSDTEEDLQELKDLGLEGIGELLSFNDDQMTLVEDKA